MTVGRHPAAVSDGDVAARVDANAACGFARRAIGRHRAGDVDCVNGDDAHRVAVLQHLRAGFEAVDVHQCAKAGMRCGAGFDAGAAVDVHIGGGQLHRAGSLDRTLDGDQARLGQRNLSAQGLLDRHVVNRAAGADQALHVGRRRRGDGEAADVDLPLRADHHAVRVEEEDVAADAPVFVSVHHPVDLAALVAHQVEQVGRLLGQMQIDRLA